MLTEDNLVNRYLQAVGFWLPRTQKADILAELSEDLHQQMEDRAEQLGHGLSEAEIKAVLKQRGQPLLVARSFLPQRSLISPVLYPIYLMVLKIVLLVSTAVWGIGALINFILGRGFAGIGEAAGSFWSTCFIQFGILTLIFAAIDRYASQSIGREDWDPGKLAHVRPSRATKRRFDAIVGLVFGIIGFGWLLALPKYPFLVIGPAALAVKAAPVWASVYPMFLVLAVAGLIADVVALLRPEMGWFHPAFKVGTSMLSLWIIFRLMQTHTYLVALDAHSSQAVQTANVIAQISVVCGAIGVVIALLVYAWQAARELSRPASPTTARLA